jgi:hypothetical protein
MDRMISELTTYFAANGSLSDAVVFVQLVAAHAVGEIAKLYKVIQGSI